MCCLHPSVPEESRSGLPSPQLPSKLTPLARLRLVWRWPVASALAALIGWSQSQAAGSSDALLGCPRSLLGASPLGLALGDFDSDGHPDLAVATGKDLRLALGTGTGTFVLSPIATPWALRPIAAATADLNGDGKPDLVLNTYTDIVVLPGNGLGTFEEPLPANVGTMTDFALEDFNGDGKLDLVLAQTDTDRLSVLLGRGDGTFQPGPRISSANSPAVVATADFNGDGRPDIAVAEGWNVSVLFGNGDGTFQTPVSASVGAPVRSFTAGDFSGDGKPDLAVSFGNSKTVSIFLGAGNGAFRAGETHEFSDWPQFLGPADLNQDGRLDLVVTTTTQLNLLLGAGDGTFPQTAAYETGSGLWSVIVADLNHDSKPDVAVGNGYSDSVSVLLGKGDGSFPSSSLYPAGPDPYAVLAADFNGDGHVDLAVANQEGPQLPANSTVSILLGRGDGTFQQAVESKTGPKPTALAAADFNNDGKLDLVTANLVGQNAGGGPIPGTVSILMGKGDGSFQPPRDYAGGVRPIALAVGDYDSDGKLDLAVGAVGQSDFDGGSVVILLGRGDGTFGAGRGFQAGKHLVSLERVDFNGDGKADLLAGTQSGAVLLLGQGDGTFVTGPQPTALCGPVIVRDVDLDGRPDLAVTTNGVWLCFGNADGTFQPGIDYGPKDFSGGVAVADLDGDGEQDLVLVAEGIGVRRGQGNGDFRPMLAFDARTRYTPVCFALADFNHDGKTDVAVANDQHVTVLLNTAGPPPLELAVHRHGPSLTVSWSSLFPEAILESTETLAPLQWVAAPETPVQRFGHWEAEIPSSSQRFFRLQVPRG
jgi:hypothetical protein